MAGFASKVKAFGTKAEQKIDAVSRKVTFEVGSSLVLKSPVGNPKLWRNPGSAPPGYVGGRFRANWQFGENEINYTITNKVDPAGVLLLSELGAKLMPAKPGRTFYLTNSLPYGPRLENDSWSSQAPSGMVRLTVMQFKATVDAVAREIASEH